jgi:hypothetical protein
MGDEAMVDVKQCPFCAEDIRTAAVKCKHCGSMLDGSATPVEPSGQPFRCLVCQREFASELERCPTCQARKGASSVMADGSVPPATSPKESGSEMFFHVSVWMIGWLLFVGTACAVTIVITGAPTWVVVAVAGVVLLGGLIGFDF